MPIKYTVTVTALGTSSVIVLPKPIVDGFNLGKGHKLELIVKDDGIYIPLEEQPSQNSTNVTASHEDTKISLS
jgi:bifunctional DNA-binding transcriptional regulator/antitoxin component of YhaV-PrlF toxin-antitoxin module